MSFETCRNTSLEKQTENGEGMQALLEGCKKYNIEIDPIRLEHFAELSQEGKGLILDKFSNLDMNLLNIRDNEYAEYRSTFHNGLSPA